MSAIMVSKAKDRVGLGFIFWGWGLLVFLSLSGISLANLMSGSYGTGDILMRPWMHTYNNALLLTHLLVILSVLLGAILADGFSQGLKMKVMRWGAIFFLATTGLCFLTMMLFPHLAEPGPWRHDAKEVAFLRVLVFLPLVTRGVGWALLITAVILSNIRPKGTVPRWWYGALVGLVTLDLGLSVWKWVTTPKAIIAVFHPYMTQPIYLIPWCMAGILFLVIIRFKLGHVRR